jgi:hypothetical protein
MFDANLAEFLAYTVKGLQGKAGQTIFRGLHLFCYMAVTGDRGWNRLGLPRKGVTAHANGRQKQDIGAH